MHDLEISWEAAGLSWPCRNEMQGFFFPLFKIFIYSSFYWNIIAFLCCGGLCHTSAWIIIILDLSQINSWNFPFKTSCFTLLNYSKISMGGKCRRQGPEGKMTSEGS